jgi:hypothetical protein
MSFLVNVIKVLEALGIKSKVQNDSFYIKTDQIDSQTIVNGFPQYENGHSTFPLGTNLVDKDYVDNAVAQDEYLIQSRTITKGTEFSGTYLYTYSQDDNSEWVLREQGGANGLNVECDFDSINLDRKFNHIYLHGWYQDGAAELEIQLWDYTNSAWETYETFIATTSIIFKTILVTDAENHTDGSGNAKIRFYQSATGATNRYLHLDYVALIKQGFGGTDDHGALSGLLDDDHPQYAKRTEVPDILRGVTVVATGASLTADLDTTKTLRISALDTNTTINNPTGSLIDGMVLYLEITGDATPRTIAYGNLFSGTTLNTLPLITVANTKMNLAFKYDATNNYLYLLAVN